MNLEQNSMGVFFNGFVVGLLSLFYVQVFAQPINEVRESGDQPQLTISGPFAHRFDTFFVHPSSSILVGAKKPEGNTECFYQIDNGLAQSNADTISFSGEGLHAISYWINSSDRTVKILEVDNSGPIVHMDWKYNSVNLGKWSQLDTSSDSERKEIICPKGTTLSISAQDSASGLASIHFSLNQAPYQDYVGPIRLLAVGSLSVRVKAIDLLGNVTEIEMDELSVK